VKVHKRSAMYPCASTTHNVWMGSVRSKPSCSLDHEPEFPRRTGSVPDRSNKKRPLAHSCMVCNAVKSILLYLSIGGYCLHVSRPQATVIKAYSRIMVIVTKSFLMAHVGCLLSLHYRTSTVAAWRHRAERRQGSPEPASPMHIVTPRLGNPHANTAGSVRCIRPSKRPDQGNSSAHSHHEGQ
jgi:hypothetical protein